MFEMFEAKHFIFAVQLCKLICLVVVSIWGHSSLFIIVNEFLEVIQDRCMAAMEY